MVKYSCETCQKTFTQKGHLEDHQNRKRPCKKDNTIEALVEQKVKEALSKTNEGAIKIDTTTTTIMQSNTMDYTKKTREELIAICKEKSIKGYSGKKKDDIIQLLTNKLPPNAIVNTSSCVLASDIDLLINISAASQLLKQATSAFIKSTSPSTIFGAQ